MPRIVKTVVYEPHELSSTAKERARAWYREHCLSYDWHEVVYDDFQAICGLLGVTLSNRPVPLMGGGTRERPCIWFRGFSSQGDGASFEGNYVYARAATGAILAYAPQDTVLHDIAVALQDVQRCNFYQLSADVRQNGRYCHEYTMTIDVERDNPTGQAPTDDAEDTITEAMRDLARWLYRQLELEYQHLTSDEVASETLSANAWTFTAEGRRFG
ncbi:MAG: antitoxin of toxin-antitoxin stability system [Gammaproteobacteria bacterium]|nr:antitoxin of toxin-antitoxin stability system [Gammaproteobacteria bacterium]